MLKINRYLILLIIVISSCNNGDTNVLEENKSETESKIKEDSIIKVMEIEMNRLMLKKDSITLLLAKKAESKINGCFEGTQNQAVLNLRVDKTFDILWTGFLFVELFEGNYEINNDTIIFKYISKIPGRINNKMIIDSNKISSINPKTGTINFYLGKCPGLN